MDVSDAHNEPSKLFCHDKTAEGKHCCHLLLLIYIFKVDCFNEATYCALLILRRKLDVLISGDELRQKH